MAEEIGLQANRVINGSFVGADRGRAREDFLSAVTPYWLSMDSRAGRNTLRDYTRLIWRSTRTAHNFNERPPANAGIP